MSTDALAKPRPSKEVVVLKTAMSVGDSNPNHPDVTLEQSGSSGVGDHSQLVPVRFKSSEAILNLDVVSLSGTVSVTTDRQCPQIPANEERHVVLQVSWIPDGGGGLAPPLPSDVSDTYGRRFRIERRLNDPGTGDLLVITLSTEDGRVLGAVTYFDVRAHQKGFPEFQLIGSGPFGWLEARS